MKVIVVKDYEEASQKAFEVMKDYLKPGKVLGLATGSTPLGLYKLMIEDHEKNGTDYKDIHTYNLDEYVGLPLNHRESYYSFMHANLFDHIGIPEENTHVPSGLGDLEENCRRYDEMIADEPVDIQLLGIGADGHIGFNEPGTPFDSGTHVTDLTEQTRKDNLRFFKDLGEEVPTQAVTMGLKTIMAARNVLLIATGENKAEAVKGLIEGPVSTECAASVLQQHPSTIVIIDEAAGKLLEKK
ncbi:MAG: glucosamine-6-phosphate deaminase [Erysipelotrichaceae bacterium]|nr:glucosamine-6-phosphate deaminase [Erysipelotrichaceae bacterium]